MISIVVGRLKKLKGGRRLEFGPLPQAGLKKPAPLGKHWLLNLKFNDVLGLGTLLALDHLKFHLLVFCQSPEPVAFDGAEVHEHIGAVFPGNKPKPLGIVKPFYRTCFSHYLPILLKIVELFPAKAVLENTGQKKGKDIQHTLPIQSGLEALPSA
jgi:hypothetical protein